MQHTWKIYELERNLSDGVVNKVTYGCESLDSGFTTRTIGNFQISGSAEDAGFIAYESLNENNVLGWLDSNVDKNAIENENSNKLAGSIAAASKITSGNGIPW